MHRSSSWPGLSRPSTSWPQVKTWMYSDSAMPSCVLFNIPKPEHIRLRGWSLGMANKRVRVRIGRRLNPPRQLAISGSSHDRSASQAYAGSPMIGWNGGLPAGDPSLYLVQSIFDANFSGSLNVYKGFSSSIPSRQARVRLFHAQTALRESFEYRARRGGLAGHLVMATSSAATARDCCVRKASMSRTGSASPFAIPVGEGTKSNGQSTN
jgi:hypothetical protein